MRAARQTIDEREAGTQRQAHCWHKGCRPALPMFQKKKLMRNLPIIKGWQLIQHLKKKNFNPAGPNKTGLRAKAHLLAQCVPLTSTNCPATRLAPARCSASDHRSHLSGKLSQASSTSISTQQLGKECFSGGNGRYEELKIWKTLKGGRNSEEGIP